MDSPGAVPVETSLGVVEVTPFNDSTLFVRAATPLVVHRVAYAVRLVLHKQQDGSWALTDATDVSISVWVSENRAGNHDPSPAARDKILDRLPAEVAVWADMNPHVLAWAEKARLNNEVVEVEQNIKKAQNEIKRLQERRKYLLKQLRGK